MCVSERLSAFMVTVPRKNFKPRADVPFLAKLASEFHRTKAHIWFVVKGERQSPLRERILARQAELMHAAAMESVTGEATEISTKPS